jgi:hypothetical protein
MAASALKWRAFWAILASGTWSSAISTTAPFKLKFSVHPEAAMRGLGLVAFLPALVAAADVVALWLQAPDAAVWQNAGEIRFNTTGLPDALQDAGSLRGLRVGVSAEGRVFARWQGSVSVFAGRRAKFERNWLRRTSKSSCTMPHRTQVWSVDEERCSEDALTVSVSLVRPAAHKSGPRGGARVDRHDPSIVPACASMTRLATAAKELS